jgi:hypothetical protein
MRQISRALIDRIAQLAQVVECDRAALSLNGALTTSKEAQELYRSTRALLDVIRELHAAPLSEDCPPTLRTGRSYPCENIPGHER